MKTYTDWNCKLSLRAAPSELEGALHFMRETLRIDRICLMAEYDDRITSVAAFRVQRERALGLLEELRPPNLKINYAAAVHLTPNLSANPTLSRLTATAKGFLPLLLPTESYADWMDAEINRLLYKSKISPLFLSFERYPILYPRAAIERLLRIPNAAYQFSYRSLCNPTTAETVAALLQRGATVLLGTECNFSEKLYRYEMEDSLAAAQSSLSPLAYTALMKNARALWK